MKSSLAAVLVVLACWGCHSSPAPAARIMVTTPTGRNEVATKRYTIEQIERGSAAGTRAKSLFDIEHPVYPTQDELATLKQHLASGSGGDVWYFQGLDSGWAIVKNRDVLWVLVTSHEY
jgi:hypothetical protein